MLSWARQREGGVYHMQMPTIDLHVSSRAKETSSYLTTTDTRKTKSLYVLFLFLSHDLSSWVLVAALSLFFFFLFYFFFFLLGFFIFLLHSVTSAFRGLYHESRQPVRFPCMFPQPSILLVNKVRRYYEASVYSCTVDPFLFIFFFWAKSDPVHLREGEGLF